MFLQIRNATVTAANIDQADGVLVARAALNVAAGVAVILLLAGCTTTPAAPVTPAASAPENAPSGAPSPSTPSPAASNVVAVPADAVAFTQLEQVAPKSLKLEGGTVASTTCWTPSEHLFNDPSVATAGIWKVLCRVRYELKGTARYQDATCIGDFDKTPMLTHCYVWEYYSYEPRYSDGPRLASPAPTPLP